VDEVWVPSTWVKECYIRSGVPAEFVQVVPNGVDTAIFHPGNPPFPLRSKKRFKFLFLGGAIKRKGFDFLMEAYTSEFNAQDDVALVVKDYGGGGGVYRLESEGAQYIHTALQNSTGPEIEYLTANMEQEELKGLYTATNLLVQPFRGEGFGMPISEMMASGGAVMIPSYGAALDFATPETAYHVPAKEVILPQTDAGDGKQAVPLTGNAYIGVVDLPSLRKMMRHAYENPEECKTKGRAGRLKMASWTWDHAAAIAERRIEALMAKPPRRAHNECIFAPGGGSCEQKPSKY